MALGFAQWSVEGVARFSSHSRSLFLPITIVSCPSHPLVLFKQVHYVILGSAELPLCLE